MICEECKKASIVRHRNLLIVAAAKKALHSKCKGGTWCDCQHRIGTKNVA